MVLPLHSKKRAAIRFAQRWGAQTIITSNEANNPMYQLNLSLGFAPLPAAYDYEKDLLSRKMIDQLHFQQPTTLRPF